VSTYRLIDPLGWTVFLEQPVHEAFLPLYDAILRTALLVAAGLGLSFLTSYALAHRMVAPILALQSAAANMGTGRMDQRISVRTGDELEALAEEFNRMSDRLRESYANLERKVEQRTQELSKANADLEAEIIERHRAEGAVSRANVQLAEANRTLEDRVHQRTQDLESANKQLVEAQDQVLRAERLAVIGQLAGGVAHDLRNPLGAIKNAVYYLEKRLRDSELARSNPRIGQFFKIIEDEVGQSNKIITDLMSYARVKAPTLSPTDIGELVNHTVSNMELKGNVRVTNQFDADLPQVMVDGEELQRVFMNLILNAQEAMPEGGELTISTRRQNGFAEVSFRDTGVGMEEDTLKKIFDPLFTTKTKGTGLGLAVCQEIVSRHKGKIEVASKPGQGATFTVTLPC
jgi:signal transduction histidine kinase